jgi:hypothetical protein
MVIAPAIKLACAKNRGYQEKHYGRARLLPSSLRDREQRLDRSLALPLHHQLR